MGVHTLEDPKQDYWVVELQNLVNGGYGILTEDGHVAVYYNKEQAMKRAKVHASWPSLRCRKVSFVKCSFWPRLVLDWFATWWLGDAMDLSIQKFWEDRLLILERKVLGYRDKENDDANV